MTFCGLRFAVSHEKPDAKGPYCHVLRKHMTVEDDPTYGWQTLIGLASQTRVKTCIH